MRSRSDLIRTVLGGLYDVYNNLSSESAKPSLLPLGLNTLSTSRITESLSCSCSTPEPKEKRHPAPKPPLAKCQQDNFLIPYEGAEGRTKKSAISKCRSLKITHCAFLFLI